MKNGANGKRNGFNNAEKTAIKNPTIGENQIVEEKKSVSDNLSQSEYYGVKITHDGFDYNDPKQKYVQYAYKLGGFEFVRMIECENGNRDLFAKGDGGDAYGLCQMNKRYHKDIPQAYYDGVWQVQLEYCYQKWKGGTKFYGPSRIIKGVRCSEYVKDRFTFTE